MRRLIIISFLSIFLYSTSIAGPVAPVVLFTNATSVGAGTATWVKESAVIDWTCDIEFTGAPSAITIRIEGNTGDIEGTAADENLTFDPTGMATHELTATQLAAKKATFGIANGAIKNIRGYVTILTGAASIAGQCGGITP